MPALLALIAVTAVWGFTFVQVKDAVALYPLFAFLAVRFAIASLVLAAPAARRMGSLGRQGWVAGVSLGLLLAAGYALQTAGLERTTVSSAGFITGLYVVFTPLLALLLFGTRVGGAVWLGVALAVVGLAMLSGVGAGDRVGDLLVLAGSAAYSVQIVLMEKYAPRYDAVAFTQAEMLAAFVRLRARCSRAWPDRAAARLDGLGRVARHGHLRERPGLPRPDLGAAADECDANRARVRHGAGLRRLLRLLAGGRPARRPRLGRLRGDHGRDRRRRARGGEDATAAGCAATEGLIPARCGEIIACGGCTKSVAADWGRFDISPAEVPTSSCEAGAGRSVALHRGQSSI